MNLFEKIHNYQILSRLVKSEIYPITALEKSWLKTMLDHDEAQYFFTQQTFEKLKILLHSQEKLPLAELFMEKAKSQETKLYHQLLAPLRNIIMKKNVVRLSTATRANRTFSAQFGIPYKLEYSMSKKEWYLLWLHISKMSVLYTPLHLIDCTEEVETLDEEYDRYIQVVLIQMETRKQTAQIMVLPQYNPELSRILYAFSCFEKDLHYNEETRTYTITLTYSLDEGEYVLSKIRFLGQRVKVIENKYLIERMIESSKKALDRYKDVPQ